MESVLVSNIVGGGCPVPSVPSEGKEAGLVAADLMLVPEPQSVI